MNHWSSLLSVGVIVLFSRLVFYYPMHDTIILVFGLFNQWLCDAFICWTVSNSRCLIPELSGFKIDRFSFCFFGYHILGFMDPECGDPSLLVRRIVFRLALDAGLCQMKWPCSKRKRPFKTGRKCFSWNYVHVVTFLLYIVMNVEYDMLGLLIICGRIFNAHA